MFSSLKKKVIAFVAIEHVSSSMYTFPRRFHATAETILQTCAFCVHVKQEKKSKKGVLMCLLLLLLAAGKPIPSQATTFSKTMHSTRY